MSTAQALALGVAVVAVLGAVGIFALAWRRERVAKAVGSLDREAVAADRARRERQPAPAIVTEEAPPTEPEPSPPPPEPKGPRAVEVSAEEYGVNRRQFLNRSLLGSFGIYLAGFGLTSLAFLWPKLSGGFGSKIDAGDVDEIKAAIFLPDQTVEPFYVAEARTYVMPFEEAVLPQSEFVGLGVVAGGLSGIFQTCVHLGCRVPWCASSQGFECPCHGSKYNLHGEYEAGPAPRNMDRFLVEVNEQNRFIIDTGSRVETARAVIKSVAYPQGVSCL